MTSRHVLIALAAAGALGLAACESDNVAPASAGTTATTPVSSGPATAGAPNAAPQGSNSSGRPVTPGAADSETPPAASGGR